MKNINKITLFCLLIASLFTSCSNESLNEINTLENTPLKESGTTSILNLEEPEPLLTEGDYIYSFLSDGTIEITGYTGKESTINIPASLNGYNITKIGDYSFNKCETLTNVIIPESVIAIGNFSFQNCKALTSVIIPNSVTVIGNYAFNLCLNLSDISIPESVTSFGTDAFYATPFLDNQTEEFIIINNHLIKYNGNEENLIIPDGIIYINDAFKNNEVIKSVVISDNVQKINDRAFWRCVNLEEVIISDTVSFIGIEAFMGCSMLSEINIHENVKEIGHGALEATKIYDDHIKGSETFFIMNNFLINCLNLYTNSNVVIPDDKGITILAGGTSRYNEKLKSVTIPEGVVKICNDALYECIYLTKVVIPDSVIEIGKDAFRKSLNVVVYCSKESFAYQFCLDNDIDVEII